MGRLGLLFVACLLTVLGWGLGTGDQPRQLVREICSGRVLPSQNPAQILANRASLNCQPANIELGQGDFVSDLRFDPVVSQSSNPLVLRMPSQWLETARVTMRYADGARLSQSFASAESGGVLRIGAIFEVKVPARAAPLTAIEVETRGSVNLRGVLIGAKLQTADQTRTVELTLTAIYSIFAGMALVLLTYNFSLWRALRNRYPLDYNAMVLALAGYTLSSSGALLLLFPQLANNDRLRINYVMLALCGVTALRFMRNFFGAEHYPRVVRQGFRVSMWMALVSGFAVAMFAPWHMYLLDKLYFVSLSVLLLNAVPVLGYPLWRRDDYSKLFALAWCAPIAISAMRALYGFGLIRYSLWLDNSSVIAMSVEALLSSLLVTARLRELSMERDVALEGEQTARRLAATDPLTGLLNRRAFLDLAIGRRSRQRLMLIDIDHFKAVNDRHGHECGDQVLKAVADAIQNIRPQRSLAVRLGGEEFALLLPRAVTEQCPPEALLDAVRNAPMPQGLKVSVSIGYSEGQVASEEDWKRLYRLADAALYRAKADGRNRSCRATDFRAAA